MTPTANTSIRRVHERRDSESVTPEPPDKTKATAGNGGESQNIKADGLAFSMVQPPTDIALEARRAESDLTFEDRHSAWLAGFDLGCAQRVEVEVEDQVQARLHAFELEALGMARRSAVHGPAFSAMVRESGERP